MPLPAGITVVIRDTSLTHSLKQYGVAKEVVILFYSDRFRKCLKEKPNKTNTFFVVCYRYAFAVKKMPWFFHKSFSFIWYISQNLA